MDRADAQAILLNAQRFAESCSRAADDLEPLIDATARGQSLAPEDAHQVLTGLQQHYREAVGLCNLAMHYAGAKVQQPTPPTKAPWWAFWRR